MKWTSTWLLNKSGENITEGLRKERVQTAVPVLVRGGAEGRLFKEATHSVSVNAYGGIVRLSAEVVLAQQMSIFNPKTKKHLSAQVTSVGLQSAGKRDIRVEFSEPSVQFWGVGFPRLARCQRQGWCTQGLRTHVKVEDRETQRSETSTWVRSPVGRIGI